MQERTQAAILCGGRGERLKPLSDYFQKVMIPIGPRKLPLLTYIIRLLRHHDIHRVALLTGYRSQDIKKYFGDGKAEKIDLTYSEDVKGITGSLNAVANAIRTGAVSNCDELLIYYGDVLTDLDMTSLLSTHRSKNADATLVLARGYTLPVGTAQVSDGFVTSFKEKPDLEISVTTGCLVVGPKGMELIDKFAGPEKTDLMTHFVPELIQRGGKVAAFYSDKEWFDVGTVSSFEKLNEELGRHPLSFLE